MASVTSWGLVMERVGASVQCACVSLGARQGWRKLAGSRKALKAFLLGTAAAIAAVSSAQAQVVDPPGTGWNNIPGWNVRYKPDGYAYVQAGINSWLGPNIGGQGNPLTLNGDIWPNTGLTGVKIGLDVRAPTDYGTFRAYFRSGFEMSAVDGGNAQATFYTERGFIQFAGFTAGKTQSYFDFQPGVFSYAAPNANLNSTMIPGTLVAAYTAQFGTG
jgi:hypothetical protein